MTAENETNAWHESVQQERQRQIAKGYTAAHDSDQGVDRLLMWAQEYARGGEPVKSAALIEAARELVHAQGVKLAKLRSYVDDPGNWSALDGRRSHLLSLCGSAGAK